MKTIEILYEDYYVLVVNKPAGITTDSANPAVESVRSMVLAHLSRQHPERKKHTVGIPHRLDKPVGGLVVVTKTPQALKDLSEQFSSRTVLKKYMGWVEGAMPEKNATLSHWISRTEDGKKAIVSPTEKQGFKNCLLEYSLLKKVSGYSLLEIQLHTGRYHQIRAQFSFTGHPVVGDEMYGGKKINDTGILLWSTTLVFRHPKTNETVRMELSTDFIHQRIT